MFCAHVADLTSVETEVNLARLIAEMANRREAATLQLRLPEVSEASEEGWSRHMRDALLLCLDRSVARIYPSLDPLQYTQTQPDFLMDEDGTRIVRLQVTPSLCILDFIPVPHQVEAKHSPLLEKPSDDNIVACNIPDEKNKWMDVQLGSKGSKDENETLRARRRWKTAAWLTARFFNEGSWYPAGKMSLSPCDRMGKGGGSGGGGGCNSNVSDIVVAAMMRNDEKRLLHVDVIGMEIVGLIVGFTSRYAYVAVPLIQEGQTALQWVLVTRVAVPSVLAAVSAEAAASRRKRPRYASNDNKEECFLHEKELKSHDVECLQVLPLDQRRKVTIRAHKVYCKRQRAASNDIPAVSVVFEDAGVVAGMEVWNEINAAECFTSYSDILHIVEESCARFIRGYERYGENSGENAVGPLFAALTDTVCVRFKKTRGKGDGRSPVAVSSIHDIPSLFEGTCVEFKAKIEKWQESVDDVASCHINKGTVNLERIRHTIAAMATTLGGVLLVGVRDDGSVIGHPREALRELRLSGFCPAMMKGNLVLNEMRTMKGGKAVAMPKEWWKKKEVQQATEVEHLVTVITVGRGQAPFYTTSRHSVPYTRGFASTVPLSVVVCARRVTSLLP